MIRSTGGRTRHPDDERPDWLKPTRACVAETVDPQFADVVILVATTEHMSDVRVALAESDRAREPTLGG